MSLHAFPSCAAVLALLTIGCTCAEERAEAIATEGLAHARAGKLDEALETFRKALETDPANAKARYNLGLALLDRGEARAAVTEFERFVDRRPEDALGLFQLARAYLRDGRQRDSLGALQRSVAAGLDHHDALGLPELEPLRSDLRFAQLEAVVAQRAGVRPMPLTEFAGRDGRGYGAEHLPVAPLPGTDINRALDCGAEHP